MIEPCQVVTSGCEDDSDEELPPAPFDALDDEVKDYAHANSETEVRITDK